MKFISNIKQQIAFSNQVQGMHFFLPQYKGHAVKVIDTTHCPMHSATVCVTKNALGDGAFIICSDVVWKSKHKDAILHHELGHYELGHTDRSVLEGVIFNVMRHINSTGNVYSIECDADDYSVQCGYDMHAALVWLRGLITDLGIGNKSCMSELDRRIDRLS